MLVILAAFVGVFMMLSKAWSGYENGGWLSVVVFTVLKK